METKQWFYDGQGIRASRKKLFVSEFPFVNVPDKSYFSFPSDIEKC